MLFVNEFSAFVTRTRGNTFALSLNVDHFHATQFTGRVVNGGVDPGYFAVELNAAPQIELNQKESAFACLWPLR